MYDDETKSFDVRQEEFNRFIDEQKQLNDYEQRNEKQNQTFHRSTADQYLIDKQTYHVRVTHLHNYVDERKYYGNMVKCIFSKEEREKIAYQKMCDIFGKENITLEDAERYIQSVTKKTTQKGDASDTIMSHNYYRSYITLRNLALANTDLFKSFITLTFEENVEDVAAANKALKMWLEQVRRAVPGFVYLGVPERQKRGAIHYHLMTNLVPGSEILPRRIRKALFNKDTREYQKIDYYDLKYWNSGYSTAFDLDMTDENFSVVSYLAKYFWKDKDDHFFGKKKVFHSTNLKKPLVEFFNVNSDAYIRYKQSLSDAVLIKSTMIESRSKYCPDVEISEFKKK